MSLYRYLLSLGLMLCLAAPAYAQAQRLHPETGEAILAPETASRSLLQDGAPAAAFASREAVTT